MQRKAVWRETRPFRSRAGDVIHPVLWLVKGRAIARLSSSIVECGARPPNNTIPHYSSSWLVARADDDLDQLYYRSYHLFTSCNVF